MKFKHIFLLILFLLLSSMDDVSAQRRRKRRSPKKSFLPRLRHEVGGNIGISNFQSDFTSKGFIDGRMVVNGFSIDATHATYLIPKTRSALQDFINHLVLKTSFGYTSGNFNNYGISTGNEPLLKNGSYTATDNYILLGRLKSKTSIITFAPQIEYYFKDMIQFLYNNSKRTNKSTKPFYNKSNMYVALGLGMNYVSATPSYDQEAIENNAGGNNGLPDNYTDNVFKKRNSIVLSGTFAVGCRYTFNNNVDIIGEIKVNQYFSDKVDAVDPGNSPNITDKFYDYNTNITLGISYRL